jgi:site-specific recombinase XerC
MQNAEKLMNLSWQQIDLEDRTVRIFGKGKKERLLPLTLWLFRCLFNINTVC